MAQMVKHLPTMRETWVQSLGQEDLLEKEMETHSSILAWKIPWMEEPDRLKSMGSQRVGHDWVTSLHFFTSLWVTVNSRSFLSFFFFFFFSACVKLLLFSFRKKHNQSNFIIDHLVMCKCTVISCVFRMNCLLWPPCPLDKTHNFTLVHSILQHQTCLLFQMSLNFLLLHSNCQWWKGHLFLVP